MSDNLIEELISGSGGLPENDVIVETTVNYQVTADDTYVAGDGAINITFPPKATFKHGFWVDCVSGPLALIADATIEAPTTLTTGMKAYFTYLSGADVWRQN